MYWERYSHEKIKEIVFGALKNNIDYRDKKVLGLPGSYLDSEVFYDDAPFLSEAPYLSTLLANPNHIGCHTLNESESAFAGTQAIERDLIKICAEQLFEGGDEHYDGYVASGGTEANIQAVWILKQYFEQEFSAKHDQIALVYSEDAHYSMPKAAKLLSLKSIVVAVDDKTREVKQDSLEASIKSAKNDGIERFIYVINMSTTMFGSVDDIDGITACLDKLAVHYMVHVDAAFGGYVYPFSTKNASLSFQNPKINSFTLDGHKMLQSPYGTGIYLTRQGFMDYALTEEANYVKGKDYTLVGSRSGANAVAIWMIMRTYGSEGWREKVNKLLAKTERFCSALKARGIAFYRHPDMNIITIEAEYIPSSLAEKYMLVPDVHEGEPKWWKIVVMDHVRQGVVDQFFADLDAFNR